MISISSRLEESISRCLSSALKFHHENVVQNSCLLFFKELDNDSQKRRTNTWWSPGTSRSNKTGPVYACPSRF